MRLNIDTTILLQALVWIVSGGGASYLAYWLIENVPFLVRLAAESKRYVSLVLPAILTVAFAILGYLAMIAMLYEPAPIDARAWIETLFAVAVLSVIGAQAIHGRVVLSKK